MRIIVTGGCGFIGSFLCSKLVKEGYDVVVFDNFRRFSPDHLAKTKNKVTIVKGDVRNSKAVGKTLEDSDCVFHLAAESRVYPSIQDFEYCFQTNVIGTYNVLEACRKTDSKIVFASSWMVYGRTDGSVSEEHPLNPISPYGISKLMGEKYCELFHNIYGLKNAVLRLSNVYGPSDKDRIIPILVTRAKRNLPIHIYGDPHILNFIYVKDVVMAFYLASVNKSVNGGIFNIGTEKSINLKDLTEILIKKCRSKSKLVIDPPNPIDIRYYLPHISKAKEKLGFYPGTDMQSGIDECIKWY